METFVVRTPPKHIVMLQERQALVTLEERLEHFIEWLQERCWTIEPHESKGTFDNDRALKELVQEYVNG